MLEEKLGSKYPQTLSQEAQSPPESFFSNKIKRFFQWLCPGIKWGEQENSQKKVSLISSVQSRGPIKSSPTFTGLFLE